MSNISKRTIIAVVVGLTALIGLAAYAFDSKTFWDRYYGTDNCRPSDPCDTKR
jgi:hypothetical protein